MSREEIGTLIVVVLKARNLNDKHTFRKQDVFTSVALNGNTQKTKVDIKGGQHPVWDDEMRFPILKAVTGKSRKMEISCYSKEPREDDLLGTATLDISDILKSGEFDEWVPLAIGETVRGDVYLEITYYDHGPPPPQAANPSPASSALAVPQFNSNLQRRPSKMDPSTRLSRPNQPSPNHGPSVNTAFQRPPQGYQQNNGYGTPVSSHRPAHSPPNKNAPLPAVPVSHSPPQRPNPQPLPGLLRPGSGVPNRPYSHSDPSVPTSPQHQGFHQAQAQAQHNPYLSPTAYSRPGSIPPPVQSNPYLASSTPAPAQNPYGQPQGQAPFYQPPNTGAPASYTPAPQQQQQQQQQQYPPPQSYTPQPQQQQPPPLSYTPAPHHYATAPPPSNTPIPTGPPPLWSGPPADNGAGGAGGFSFPQPNVMDSGPADPYNNMPGSWTHSPPRVTSPYEYGGGHRRRESDPRADPALMSRYQTPLPLPPGATRPSSSLPQTPAKAPSPPPPARPAPAPAPAPAPQPARKAHKASPGPDTARLTLLMRAEEEATRRREQEKKDLELAMQLDRELNL
ncbi:hypothetical protein D9611_001916 [Ephemerocybe angulata]|uniref:C2 domain-containing protein n=1 Tax=Ephemerocybe angulata TaxID=980116 RepID=A0A8H5CJ01_9AGAR|nr:hypothetical protein D9611_001916 [Tulosesus angulatus]